MRVCGQEFTVDLLDRIREVVKSVPEISRRVCEWLERKALHCDHYQTSVPPDEPPGMAQAIRMLATMGGHLGRRSDGPPGTQVIWRGLQYLDVAVQMYITFTRAPPPRSWPSYPEGYLSYPQGP